MHVILVILSLWAQSSSLARAGRILLMPAGIIPSHRMVFMRLAEELVAQKHEVIVWQTALKRDTRFAVAGVEERVWTVEVPERYIRNMFLHENSSIFSVQWSERVTEPARKAAHWSMMTRVCELLLERRKTDFERLLAEHFDVLVVDDLYNPCGLLYVALSRRPFVYWSQTPMRTETAWSNQSPSPPSYVPVPGTAFTDDMSFWQRSFNLLSYLKSVYIHQRMILRPIDAVWRRHFPQLTDAFYVERNASLNFINTPPVFDFPRPFMPRVVFVGGLQCRKAQPLQGELEQFVSKVDDSKGFLLFSTGFSVHWDKAPAHIRDAFVDAFRSLADLHFIWQYNGPPIAQLPPNVLTVPWLPQQDLLGHSKCRGLISHGGLNSVVEGLWHGQPILGIPLYTEHKDYLLRATARKAGLILDKQFISAAAVARAVRKLLKTEYYAQNARLLQDLLRDVPYSELEHAAFWIGFVSRHQEVPQARSGADELNVLQYFLVDVLLFLCACFLLWILLSFYALKLTVHCVRRFCGRGTASPALPKKGKTD